jgi:hypothetical protein
MEQMEDNAFGYDDGEPVSTGSAGAQAIQAVVAGSSGTGIAKSPPVPRVIKYAYDGFKLANGKWFATCTVCHKTLSDKYGVSSTFTK